MVLFLLPVVQLQMGPAQPVFVSKRIDGSQAFDTYRIPALCKTRSGVLLAFAEGRNNASSDQAENAIVLSQMSAGRWTAPRVIFQISGFSLNNPCVLATAYGPIWIAFESYPRGRNESTVTTGTDPGTTCHAYVSVSRDGGKTWAPPTDITDVVHDESTRSCASGPGIGVELRYGSHRGRLLFPVNEGAAGNYTTFSVYSDDQGRSWHRGQNTPKPEGTNPNEVQFVELSGGKLLLNARNQGAAKCRLTAESLDGGVTWSQADLRPDLPDPTCMASIVRLSWKPSVIAFSNPANSRTRSGGFLKISRDEGLSWETAGTIEPGDFSYSSLCPLSKTRLGILYETSGRSPEGKSGYEIVYRELRLGS